jgi:nitrous-oxide reductase
MAMIDLRDFRVKQVLDVPNIQTSHGGMFVTPDSEYAMISSKFPMVWPPGDYADVSEYEEKYRGASSWLKIDADTGFIDFEESFQIEIPPYVQDLGDAGKLVSEGWGFIGSFNTEMSIGADFENDAVIGEAMEAGASRNNFDFLHVINWRKAEEVIAAGDYEEMNGMKVIRMETAIEEGLLYLISEPKSPHGIDVDPSGRYLVVSGKLDPHVTIYDFLAVQDAIENEDFEGVDPFGIPILTFDSVVAGSVEVGLGPLHTQFDDKGHGYTSLFLEPAIGKFSLGDDVIPAGEEPFVLQDKISVHYNIGHLATAEGDTVSPDSNWMVALNKWSIDRFPPVGPLHPQNFQLIDIKDGLAMAETNPMDLVADMPIGVGEPHYAQIMKRDKLDSIVPDVVRVKEGDTVKIHVTNIEEVRDATHGFAIADYNIQASLEPGEVANFEFVADKAGAYNFYCTEFCSALHLEMAGWFLVEPASAVAAP